MSQMLTKKAMKAAELLHVFSQTHPVAEPALLLVLGMVEAQRKNHEKALFLLDKGLDNAVALDMPFMEGLLAWRKAILYKDAGGVWCTVFRIVYGLFLMVLHDVAEHLAYIYLLRFQRPLIPKGK